MNTSVHRSATTTVLDNIGLLVTNDPRHGDGPLGLLRNASVVVADERIVSVGAAGQVADRRIDVAGACVVPGFVDSHTHLVFAGDRGDEFAARMAGQPYAAGGIRTSVAATRAASIGELTRLAGSRRAEARRAGITTIEIKSGYGLTPHDEARCLQVGETLTTDTTFLGAHVVPPEFDGRTDDYVHHVCHRDAVGCSAPRALDRCVLRSRRVRPRPVAAPCWPPVRLRAWGCGCTPTSSVTARACNWRWRWAAPRPTTAPTSVDDDIAALASSDTVATFLPATDFSTRQPYPDARRVLDAGVTVALATNCNPGSSYTTSMSFCLALAVRDLHMTMDEALRAATVGGARALRRDDVGVLAPGYRADLVVLDAPSYTHLVYRPGVPLIRTVIEGGVIT
jgi:imidazolonepropionase